jgi:hypothetical protein
MSADSQIDRQPGRSMIDASTVGPSVHIPFGCWLSSSDRYAQSILNQQSELMMMMTILLQRKNLQIEIIIFITFSLLFSFLAGKNEKQEKKLQLMFYNRKIIRLMD